MTESRRVKVAPWAVPECLNTATFAYSSQAADAIGRAMGMSADITQGDKMIAKELKRIEKRIGELDGGADVIV